MSLTVSNKSNNDDVLISLIQFSNTVQIPVSEL